MRGKDAVRAPAPLRSQHQSGTSIAEACQTAAAHRLRALVFGASSACSSAPKQLSRREYDALTCFQCNQ